jgi:translocator protein
MKRTIIRIIIAIAACELFGSIGALFTMPSIGGWYAGLNKAALNPPSWVFAPVWTMLFALMGVAAFLIWQKGLNNKGVKTALWIFIGQFALNILWSVLFFGLHDPWFALIDIAILWLAIGFTILSFRKVSPTAAWLMVPYFLWVTFASYLNYSVAVLN